MLSTRPAPCPPREDTLEDRARDAKEGGEEDEVKQRFIHREIPMTARGRAEPRRVNDSIFGGKRAVAGGEV